MMAFVSWPHSSSDRLQVSSSDTLNILKAILPIGVPYEQTSSFTIFPSPSWMAYKSSHTSFVVS